METRTTGRLLAWVDYEGDFVVIDTAEGRAKPRNMRNDPRVKVYVQPEIVKGANE